MGEIAQAGSLKMSARAVVVKLIHDRSYCIELRIERQAAQNTEAMS
jgi:hypothetical protein